VKFRFRRALFRGLIIPNLFASVLWLIAHAGDFSFVHGKSPWFIYCFCFSLSSTAISLYEWIRSTRNAAQGTNLPSNAEFLFYLFLDAQDCDALVGDLEERYGFIRKKFGMRRANFWYWTQALHSVVPIIWAWATNHLKKPVAILGSWALGSNLVKSEWLRESLKKIVAEVMRRIGL